MYLILIAKKTNYCRGCHTAKGTETLVHECTSAYSLIAKKDKLLSFFTQLNIEPKVNTTYKTIQVVWCQYTVSIG